MSEHTFDGHADTTYHEKDAHGQPLGTVIPGEIRHLAQALDHWWREATEADRERWEAIKAARAAAAEAGDDGGPAGEETGTPPPPAPAPAAVTAPAATAGQPAPPAVTPQPVPSASTSQQEG